MNGWNRIDIYNILGNPFTTTRPQVRPGRARAVHPVRGAVHRRVPARRPDRRVRVRRPAGADLDHLVHRPRRPGASATPRALTASITGGSIGLPRERLHHRRAAQRRHPGEGAARRRCGSPAAASELRWVGGAFYSRHRPRLRPGPASSTGFEPPSRACTSTTAASPRVDHLFFSDLHYELKQFALFGEATWSVTDRFDLTGGAALLRLRGEPQPDLRRHLRRSPSTLARLGRRPTASRRASSPAYEAQRRAPGSTPRCRRASGSAASTTRSTCRSARRRTSSPSAASTPGRTRRCGTTRWARKSTVMGGRGTFNASAFYMDIEDLQATIDRRPLLVAHHPQRAEARAARASSWSSRRRRARRSTSPCRRATTTPS